MRKASQLDLASFEDAEFYDRLERAREDVGNKPIEIIYQFSGLGTVLITAFSLCVLLFQLSWWLALIAFNFPYPLSRLGWLPICDKVVRIFVYLLQCIGMFVWDGYPCSECGPNWTASLLKELVAPVWDCSRCSLLLHIFSVVAENPSGGRICYLRTKTR